MEIIPTRGRKCCFSQFGEAEENKRSLEKEEEEGQEEKVPKGECPLCFLLRGFRLVIRRTAAVAKIFVLAFLYFGQSATDRNRVQFALLFF